MAAETGGLPTALPHWRPLSASAARYSSRIASAGGVVLIRHAG